MTGASNMDGGQIALRRSGGPNDRDVSGALEAIESADRLVAAPRLLIVSDIRFLREGLAEALMREREFHIAGAAHDFAEAVRIADAEAPEIILIDAALPDGPVAAGRLRERLPRARLVALAVVETETEIIAWATAGVCGYVPRSAGLSEL